MTICRSTQASGLRRFELITSSHTTHVTLAVTEVGRIIVSGPLDLSADDARLLVTHQKHWITARLQHLTHAAAAVAAGLSNSAGGPCPRCHTAVGERHTATCDVALCRVTGHPRTHCGHVTNSCNSTWTGQWPGHAECIEYGFYTRIGPHGYEQCGPGTPDALPDLSRLRDECRWDVRTQRMVRPA
ncbi:hypothetical protein SMD44_p10212 (plasmid) [Streptomyces alboflavus]|uniref:Uncharacterized protein n=1 Tax=Streptomyces alboflavus TaxID=67267 RepID=A0A291W4Z9_9ACTN|nr:hypothetical protein [Streptomyces alboflavus]ATM24711.1 hypothetical protein SMD44_p10212 [Streptomyces alboflavus]